MKNIIVSGSVATGKTTLAKKLSKLLNYRYIGIKELLKKNKLVIGYDKKRKAKIVDDYKFVNAVVKIIKQNKNGLIIDSHLSHLIPSKYIDLCIITKCNLKVLKKRLENNGYDKDKVMDNLETEIMDICLNEAYENKHNVLVIDSTKNINLNSVVRYIKRN